MKRLVLIGLLSLFSSVAGCKPDESNPCPECPVSCSGAYTMEGHFIGDVIVTSEGEVLFEGLRYFSVDQSSHPATLFLGALGLALETEIWIQESGAAVYDIADGWNYVLFYEVAGTATIDSAFITVDQSLREEGETTQVWATVTWEISNIERVEDPYGSDAAMPPFRAVLPPSIKARIHELIQ